MIVNLLRSGGFCTNQVFPVKNEFYESNIQGIRMYFLIYHYVKSVRIRSLSGPYFLVFTPNARKHGPEKL